MAGKRLFYFLTLLILFQSPFYLKGYSAGPGDSVVVSKIWDKAAYNSFTDLIRFNHAFYCSFREGDSHADSHNNGKVRILRSEDGTNWHSVALLKLDGLDLRDPKLSVTPDHRMMVIMAAAAFSKDMAVRELFPVVSFSDVPGNNFTDPETAVMEPDNVSQNWIWRVTWQDGAGYGVDYRPAKITEGSSDRDATVVLMKTKDGRKFNEVSPLAVKDYPNESTVRFDKNKDMVVLVRRDGGDKMGFLAKSKPPYTDWTYTKLDYRLGGPNFLFLNKHKLVIGTREYGTKTTTAILVTDLNGRRQKTINLPSGGDTGYPGLVIHKKALWVSYYSSHEGKAGIYLARIPLKILD